jgi:hypothetical protein
MYYQRCITMKARVRAKQQHISAITLPDGTRFEKKQWVQQLSTDGEARILDFLDQGTVLVEIPTQAGKFFAALAQVRYLKPHPNPPGEDQQAGNSGDSADGESTAEEPVEAASVEEVTANE